MRSVSKTLAENLRRLRTKHGFSLATLAERSGVAKATLANLEHGRGNPTIETVWSLAIALDVPFSDLFEDSHDTGIRYVPADEGPHVLSQRHGSAPPLDLRLVDRVETGWGLTEIFDMRFVGKGVQHGKAHASGVVERMLIFEGRILAGPADSPYELGPGDFLRYPGDQAHIYKPLVNGCRGVLLVSYPASRID